MKFYADLHIHSRFSRACSNKLTIYEIYKWSKIKGITVIGTSDFLYPEWIEEIKTYLRESDDGLLELKKEYRKKADEEVPPTCQKNKVRFMLSVEISLIYKKNDKTRKVHILILAPDIDTAQKLRKRLLTIGNLDSDGRPILGFDSRDLLEVMLETNEECMLIPSHIWTPWFSMFGDKSGFDSIYECFEDLSEHIHAIETGLSSDPKMNWMVKDLDKVTITSNSDAHSSEKIAREGNIFNCDLRYDEMVNAIKTNDKRFLGTLEFYPQEGKYHHDGHRSCNINWSPAETKKHKEICTKCNRPVTVGVSSRVHELADRKDDKKPKGAKPFHYVIPLKEILSEISQKGVGTKTVNEYYFKIINNFGSELSVALEVPISKLSAFDPILGNAIKKIRSGKVNIIPGYDGLYGEVSIFGDGEREKILEREQMSLI